MVFLKGTGAYKLGVNYAPGILPQKEAAQKGYAQNLWLHGPEHFLTEVGTMNLFVVFNRNGIYEIVTPPLDGMILPGVTRDSVLALARDHERGKLRLAGLDKDVIVSERPVTMTEVQEASRTGQLVEMFGAGDPISCVQSGGPADILACRNGCRDLCRRQDRLPWFRYTRPYRQRWNGSHCPKYVERARWASNWCHSERMECCR